MARHDLVTEIREVLAAAGDPERARAQQAYMKSAMPFHGIGAPALKALLRTLLADPAYRMGSREEWEATVRELWDGATHREERYAALALTGHRTCRAWQDPQALPLYEHLVTTGAWWDLVDPVASDRVGPILLRFPEEVAPVVRRWAVGDHLWLRRTAILSQLKAGERTDTGLLHDCIEPNLDDSSFWIRKAIGWALRSYARSDPAWVRAEVARCGPRLSGLSRREALKHL
ncbi:DNA alkylation repair protein [Phycicoccus sp. SLBN-51]|uniref:DNA alkylation repair protein n=1 Tax=Phycicoccus sp. SLBN-51 TaxID=2768447 RepID=UPI00115438AD|nr:DNA alkylation repair protein [Phycicoccus sp. SLBN-51]TQJ48795.1 3-methyladenine DNA glycosylase AlkD [Phycicoccus sp. SLBN-51]